MKEPKRQSGFYWVKYLEKSSDLEIAQFDDKYGWSRFGISDYEIPDSEFFEINETRITQLPSKEEIEKFCVEYGESFKTGEWFETLRIEAAKAGAEFVLNFGKDKKE